MADANANDPLSGIQQAAILLMTLGEAEAAQVLKHLGPKEVEQLGLAMVAIDNVTRDQAIGVMDKFNEAVEKSASFSLGGEDYLKKVMVAALGEGKANLLIKKILSGKENRSLEALSWLDANTIAALLRDEHPQIIAIVLTCLEQSIAADVLSGLAEEVRGDVMMRIATLEGIPPQALEEIEEIIINRKSANVQNQRPSAIGGAKLAAGILNNLDAELEENLMAHIKERDNALGEKLNELMFVFDNLAEMDDRSIQAVLRDVQTDKLGVALRGADPKVREKITKNMSKRAADMLIEDMEARGPVRLADVEAAQKDILAVVRRLAEAGTVQLGGRSGDFV